MEVSSPTMPAVSALEPLPRSTLIISSRNRHQLLYETVESILSAQELPTELIILDQSDEPSPALAALEHSMCAVRYVPHPSIGASRARNYGAALASHPILAFIDDDMFVAPDWYGALIRALVSAGTQAAVTGRVAAGAPERPVSFVVAVHDWAESRTYAGRIGRDVLATGHMALYRATFEAVGGLDERLGPGTRFEGAEDNDLGFRLLEARCRIVYVPGSLIYHRSWRPQGNYVPHFWTRGRGQGAFYAKHLRATDLYMLRRFGWDIGRYLRLFPQRIYRRRLLELAGSTASLAGELAGGAEWMVMRGAGRV